MPKILVRWEPVSLVMRSETPAILKIRATTFLALPVLRCDTNAGVCDSFAIDG
jgi:hypothetical protein